MTLHMDAGRFPAIPIRTSTEDASYDSLSAALQGPLAQGMKTLVVTSSGAGEGKSTVTAGLGRALARSGQMSVVLIDTDRFRPTLHRLFELENRRGLGELLKDLYHLDIEREVPGQFGIGDWIEIMQAQSRSGQLRVTDAGEQFVVVFHRGRIVSIQMPQHENDMRIGELLVQSGVITEEQKINAVSLQQVTNRALGEVMMGLSYLGGEALSVALRTQFRESMRRLMTLHRPECTFTETAEAYLPATSGQHAEPPLQSADGEKAIHSLADYLKRPFLASQIPSYLKDTSIEGLKVLTSGSVSYNLAEARFATPFRQLIYRLCRIFDVVLMDSPPVALASPTETLASFADGVIMVVKADGFDAEVAQQAKAQLEKVQANILGVVLNQVDLRHADPLLYYYGAYQP